MRLSGVRRGFGGLVLLKSVDLADRMPSDLVVGWALLAIVVFAGVLLLADRSARTASVAVTAGLVGIVAANDHGLWNNHTYLMALEGLILGVFHPLHQPTLMRVQLTVLYGFAALSKVNGAYLTGAEIERALTGPALHWITLGPDQFAILAIASIVVEGFLAIGLWFRRTRVAAVVVGAAFHLSLVLAMSPRWDSAVRLVVFAGAALLLYPAFFEDDVRPTWRAEVAAARA